MASLWKPIVKKRSFNPFKAHINPTLALMMALTIQGFTTVGSTSVWYMYLVAQNLTITLLYY